MRLENVKARRKCAGAPRRCVGVTGQKLTQHTGFYHVDELSSVKLLVYVMAVGGSDKKVSVGVQGTVDFLLIRVADYHRDRCSRAASVNAKLISEVRPMKIQDPGVLI